MRLLYLVESGDGRQRIFDWETLCWAWSYSEHSSSVGQRLPDVTSWHCPNTMHCFVTSSCWVCHRTPEKLSRSGFFPCSMFDITDAIVFVCVMHCNFYPPLVVWLLLVWINCENFLIQVKNYNLTVLAPECTQAFFAFSFERMFCCAYYCQQFSQWRYPTVLCNFYPA